uniref:Venom protein n=2 Tax=Caenorhabditis tropicalis TaxID=1561998 RepID=A0A1I7U095_9PELO
MWSLVNLHSLKLIERFKMKLIIVIFMYLFSTVTAHRSKRDSCESTYGGWTEWTACDSDCGFCGTQTRSRECAPVAGCSEVTCSGDSTESQPCSTTDDVCLAPSPSCCPHTYKKMADISTRRFYCGLEE